MRKASLISLLASSMMVSAPEPSEILPHPARRPKRMGRLKPCPHGNRDGSCSKCYRERHKET